MVLLIAIGLCSCDRQATETFTAPTPLAEGPTFPRELRELHVTGRVVDGTGSPWRVPE
jgi:hypothetical protein